MRHKDSTTIPFLYLGMDPLTLMMVPVQSKVQTLILGIVMSVLLVGDVVVGLAEAAGYVFGRCGNFSTKP